MNNRCVRIRLPLLAVVPLLISCGDDQSPADVTFDVAGTAEALGAVRNVVMSPALGAHLALSPRFAPPGASPTSAGRQKVMGQQIAVLPAEFMGTTFAIENAQGSYQPTEMTGAPENALRFIVYAVTTSGDPIVETAIGHADLTDEGVEMENGFAVGVIFSVDDLVAADYTTSFDADGESPALARASVFDHVGLNIAGRFRTDTDEIQIDMITGTVNGIITTEFAVVSGDATVAGDMMEEQASGLRLFQGEFQLREDRLNVTANGSASSFAAEITVNGMNWATVNVQAGSVTATGPQGALDSTEESIALRMAEYFLMVPNLASGLVPGVLGSES